MTFRFLLILLCLAPQSTIIAEDKLVTLAKAVQIGLSSKKVEETLGIPNITIAKNDDTDINIRTKSDNTYGYYHPEYATIILIIGFHENTVNSINIWKIWGTKPPLKGVIQSVDKYNNETK